MNFAPPPEPLSDFDKAAVKLIHGLGDLHRSTNPKIEFSELALDIRRRLDEADVAADLVDQYVGDKVESDKLGHFIETALAFAFQATRLNDDGSDSPWQHLCQAYFVAGMATLQLNIARGAHLRVQPYAALKRTILELVESRCPAEKWASFEDMWRSIEDAVIEENDKFEGRPGFSKNPKAAFDRLRTEMPDHFLSFRSGPVKRGRPPKKRPRG